MSKAPLKAAFFVWIVSLGKILTIDYMRKHFIILADWCVCVKGVVKRWITCYFIVMLLGLHGMTS